MKSYNLLKVINALGEWYDHQCSLYDVSKLLGDDANTFLFPLTLVFYGGGRS